MKSWPSFRGRLAARFGVVTMALAVMVSGTTYFALRLVMYDRLDTLLHRLAQIEASATSDSPGETFHFHDAVYETAESDVQSRFAEVWTLTGEPVVRTANLTMLDLPLPNDVRQRVVATNTPEFFSFRWNGVGYRSYLYPLALVSEQHRRHLLQVATSTSATKTVLRTVIGWLSVLVLVGVIAGAAAGWWLAGYAVRPVIEITRQAEAFELQGENHRITARSDTTELNRLIAVLNSMLARIDDGLDLQRRFLADAGHSIMTPMTILRGDIDVALQRPRSTREYQSVLSQTLIDLKGVTALADDLITLARSDGGALVPDFRHTQVSTLLARVERRFASTARRADVKLRVVLDVDFAVVVDATLLDRAIGNIVDNALRYAADGEDLVMTASVDKGGDVILQIVDRGPGISADQLPMLPNRFFRGGASHAKGRGSGLGLAIAKVIVESHHGALVITSQVGQGTTVTIRLPGSSSGDLTIVRTFDDADSEWIDRQKTVQARVTSQQST